MNKYAIKNIASVLVKNGDAIPVQELLEDYPGVVRRLWSHIVGMKAGRTVVCPLEDVRFGCVLARSSTAMRIMVDGVVVLELYGLNVRPFDVPESPRYIRAVSYTPVGLEDLIFDICSISIVED